MNQIWMGIHEWMPAGLDEVSRTSTSMKSELESFFISVSNSPDFTFVVAAVAAGVLIQTASSLQSKADTTGKAVQQRIATGFSIVEVLN